MRKLVNDRLDLNAYGSRIIDEYPPHLALPIQASEERVSRVNYFFPQRRVEFPLG